MKMHLKDMIGEVQEEPTIQISHSQKYSQSYGLLVQACCVPVPYRLFP